MTGLEIILYFSGIVFFVFMQGFFSCTEMSIVSSNRLKIHYLAKEGNKAAILIENFLKNPHRFLGTTLVGVNLAVVISSALTASLISGVLKTYFPEYWNLQPVISTVLIGPFVLLFGEVIPNSLGRHYNNIIALKAVKILNLFYYNLYLIIVITTGISRLIGRIAGADNKEKNVFSHIDEIKILFQEGSEQGAIKKDILFMLNHIFNFKYSMAKDVMCPLINVKMIDKESSIKQLIELIATTGYSHIPVYENRVDNVIGMINIKNINLNQVNENDKIDKFISKAYYIPETKKINIILQEMKISFNHFAVVVDEFGGVTGVLTIEDIIEEIVGEIEDEYKKKTRNSINSNRKNNIILNASTELELCEEKFGINFDNAEEVNTIGGYVSFKAGRIPKPGYRYSESEFEITVTDSDEKHIKEVRLDIK